jgi:hypothetical protein
MRMIRGGILVVMLGGAWLALSYSLGSRSLAVDSKTWPVAVGVVVTAEVSVRSSRGGDHFEPRVTYSYIVAGASYTGSVVRSGGFDYGNRLSAEAMLAEYPVGSAVDVLYDPDDARRTVLESGGGGNWWLFAVAGVAAGGTGLILLGGSIRDVLVRHAQASVVRMP